jgi:cell division protein FtsW (lipid II flippase)
VFMQRNVAYLLLIVMLGLIALGLVMLSSTSAVLAPSAHDMDGVYSNLRKQFGWLVISGIVCVFLSRYDYQKMLRYARIIAWWTSLMHPEHVIAGGKGWQQLQALIALGSGGLSGLGLGNSRQKMYWLPEVNTDFVFPIIGEELGMWVTLSVVVAFLLLMLCSGWITIHAPDPAGVMLGTGLTVMIALQALMNLAVVTSIMPPKGIPLPFISYGGSNLLTCMAAIGILFNMHRQGIYQVPAVPKPTTKAYSVRM